MPEQLLTILGLDNDLKAVVANVDARQLDEAELRPNYVEPKRKRERATLLDISLWVFCILAALMIVERLMSNYKNNDGSRGDKTISKAMAAIQIFGRIALCCWIWWFSVPVDP